MKNIKKSSVVNLVDYLSNSQDKQERVDSIRVTNCGSLDGDAVSRSDAVNASLEMAFTQDKNKRAVSDKTYHMLISFRAGDKPEEKTLKEIEIAFCDALGFSDHQRVSVIHRDTDNLHIHVAINKIHPARLTIHEPFNDNWIRDQLAVDLEKKYGLQPDNHIHTKTSSQTKVADMEAHSGEQSLVGWIKQECLDELQAAQSWDDLKHILSENGLELRTRGNGFILESTDGTRVKASTVDRGLSKLALEKRLGPFSDGLDCLEKDVRRKEEGKRDKEQSKFMKVASKKEYKKRPIPVGLDTSRLYARFQVERGSVSETKKRQMQALSEERKRRIEVAKVQAKLKRSTLKLGSGRIAKKLAYWQIQQSFSDTLANINVDIARQKKTLIRIKPQTWADWLRVQAVKGDAEALAVMRAKDNAAIKRVERQKKDAGVSASGSSVSGSGVSIVPDGITKTGTVIFKSVGGAGAVRDDGKQFSLSKQADDATLVFAMKAAAQRDGSVLSLTGSEDFQRRAAELAGQSGLEVTFRNLDLEKIRKQEGEKVRREQPETRSERPDRTDRRDNGGVSVSSRSNKPRRDADAARGKTVTSDRDAFLAAEKYVYERSKTRFNFFYIPKYSIYSGGAGELIFVGIRRVENHSLALMKKADNPDIFVLPIDMKTEKRLARLKRGSQVVVTSEKKIFTKQGTRRCGR